MPFNTLPPEYPERLLGCGAEGFPTFENAVLHGLSTKTWNGAPVRVIKYFENKERYQVEIIADSQSEARSLLVKRVNIQVFPLADISEAYSDFEEYVHADSELLNLLAAKPDDWEIFGKFFDFQLPPVADLKALTMDCAWTDVCYNMTTYCRSYGLAITKEHCPLILSFLYHWCFDKFIFLWKKYLIPTTWNMVYDDNFGEGIWAMKPPKNDNRSPSTATTN